MRTAADHLDRAEELLEQAGDLWRTYAVTRSVPEQMACAEGASTAARIASAHVALARELRISDDLPALLGVVDGRRPVEPVPLEEYRPSGLGRFKSKAAAADTATADLHDPTTPEEA